MRRFNVQIDDSHTAQLYYRTPEDARMAFPSATITEITDTDHLPAIKVMIERAINSVDASYGNDDIRTLMLFHTPFGKCEAMISRDSIDGKFYDYCRYRLYKHHRVAEPVCWSVSTPVEFVSKFLLTEPVAFEVLCSSPKVSKPTELKNVTHIASINYDGRACQVFIKGKDAYIKHGNYFSPSVTALSSPDGKGRIYMRVAWLKISNLIPITSCLNAIEVSKLIWDKVRSYHGWSENEQNCEWERFGTQVANAIKNYFEN